jgi:hypothetical protein
MPKSETFVVPLKLPPPAHETSISGLPGSGILKPALEVKVVKIRSPSEAVTFSGLRVESGIMDIDMEFIELSWACAKDC